MTGGVDGPAFHVVLVAVRPDGVALYLADRLDPRRRAYARVRLNEAARFRDRDAAVDHLEVFPEHDARAVRLIGVSGEAGDWRGWHRTGYGIDRRLHGPDGGWVSPCAEAPRPWIAFLPDAAAVADAAGRPRRFSTALAARRVLGKALFDFLPEDDAEPDPGRVFSGP